MNQYESDSKTRILRYIWGAFPWFIVIALVVSSFVMCGRINKKTEQLTEEKKKAVKEETSIKIATLTLKPGLVQDRITLPAVVESFEDLWVKAEVSGLVVKTYVKEGDMVQKGQVLVELDSRDYVTRLERIETAYKQAVVDRDRMAALFKKNSAAASEMDKVETQVKDLEAQRSEAKLALERTKITAPITGRLNELEAKVGDNMANDKPVARILQIGQVKVTVGIPESDVSSVMDLDSADIVIEALENLKLKGRKLFLSRQTGDMARVFNLELVVDNSDGKILPGMFASVSIVKKSFSDSISIPLYAVISQGTESFVYVENNNKAEKRVVTLGVLEGWMTQVNSGLKAGDRVIIVGHRQVDDGQAVQVIKNVTDVSEITKS
jgi:membrane fusion protein, multidrug efflux system